MDQRQARSDCKANVIRTRTRLDEAERKYARWVTDEHALIAPVVEERINALESFCRAVAQLAVMEIVTVNVNPYPHLVEVGPSGIDSPTHYRGPRVGA